MTVTPSQLLTRLRTEFPLQEMRNQDGPVYQGQLWNNKQRVSHSLHEVPYRACFQGTLPEFFIERLTDPLGVVFDPFMGRGTTLVQAALMGRKACGSDALPLPFYLTAPRLTPLHPGQAADFKYQLEQVLRGPYRASPSSVPADLAPFFHLDTYRELLTLQNAIRNKMNHPEIKHFDLYMHWAQMVALSRLTGHSSGYFSAYSLPPNQAVTPISQAKINAREGAKYGPPQYRPIVPRIIQKTGALLKNLTSTQFDMMWFVNKFHQMAMKPADVPWLPANSVDLLVTSPPFLDVVNYLEENWVKNWFIGLPEHTPPVMHGSPEAWILMMASAMRAWWTQLKPGAWLAVEAGECKGINLNEIVMEIGKKVGFTPVCTIVQLHFGFTKTSHIYGVENGKAGTNTQRVSLMVKPC